MIHHPLGPRSLCDCLCDCLCDSLCDCVCARPPQAGAASSQLSSLPDLSAQRTALGGVGDVLALLPDPTAYLASLDTFITVRSC